MTPVAPVPPTPPRPVPPGAPSALPVQIFLAVIAVAVALAGVLAATGVLVVRVPGRPVAVFLGAAIPLAHALVTRFSLAPKWKALVAVVLIAAATILSIAAAAGSGTFSLSNVAEQLGRVLGAGGGSLAMVNAGPVVNAIHRATDPTRLPALGPKAPGAGQGKPTRGITPIELNVPPETGSGAMPG